MTTYCAFLRGVNVKGTNMKMADVCNVFSKCGLSNVTSILASGNIVFSSTKTNFALKKLLEKAMSEHFNYEAFLFLKDKNQVEQISSKNPFKPQTDYHIYGFVGVNDIETVLMNEFQKAEKILHEEAEIVAGNFYWKVSKGNTLNSEFGKILGNKRLKNSFTSRNMNTFEKVYHKM